MTDRTDKEKLEELNKKVKEQEEVLNALEAETLRVIAILEEIRKERDELKLQGDKTIEEKTKLIEEKAEVSAGIDKAGESVNRLEARMVQFHNRLKNVR